MGMTNQLNIDDFVDYAFEYRSMIPGGRIQGERFIGKCPFHDDKRESFTANIKTGECHCFAGCIDGNYISFLAKYNNSDTKTAYKQILDKYGKTNEGDNIPKLRDLTLTEYSFNKKLPEEFLTEVCKVSSSKGSKDNIKFVKIPYIKEDGSCQVYRKRYGNKEFRWSYGASGKLCMYGEWRLSTIRQAGYAVLVEGESDTQTLWHLDVSALGVPGASSFNDKMSECLEGLKLYIHVEPDKGGETFLSKICKVLQEKGFAGDVYTWSCKQFGVKDPSALFIEHGKDKAKEEIASALKKATKIDIDDTSDTIPEAISDAPARLRQPEGWIYSDKGISKINEKTAEPSLICRTPIILTKRLKSMETGEEKIEIAFKRDGSWHRAIFPRSTIFTSRNITILADLGCTVTSENAKPVVKFLGALEAENIDIITREESTSTFGWQTKGRFLPGHGDDITLDIEPSLRGWAAAYHTNGTLQGWVDTMRQHRSRDKFRFILAASFAAPLLRILKQRIFVVYNWGSSKCGKTSALKAALSAWGDPERLMVNFNATQVALERMAGFYNDLPLGIDERQLAGQKQESLEKIIYMLASGTGRARGSKGGGLQALNTWRTVALATGEEPLSNDTTQTGVSTRVLEIYGGPFQDEKSASLMHQQAGLNYGWAGPEYIRRILRTDERTIISSYERMVNDVYELANGVAGSHIAGIAAVALADCLIEKWLFSDKEETAEVSDSGKDVLKISGDMWYKSLAMAKTIIQEQLSAGIADVNENATQFIVDWIHSNRSQFGERTMGTCFGDVGEVSSEARGKVYIFPSILNQALSKAGYSARKTLKYLAESEIITSSKKTNGGKEYSVTRRFNGEVCRFIEFDLAKFSKPVNVPGNEDKTEFNPVKNASDVPFESENQEELPF